MRGAKVEGPRVRRGAAGRGAHLHQGGHDGVLHQHRECAAHAQVVRGHGLSRAAQRHHHVAQPLAHVVQPRGQRQHRHDLAGHADVETRHALMPRLRVALPHRHAAQVAVAHVRHALPGDGGGVNVKAHEARALLAGERLGVLAGQPQLLCAPQLHGGEEAGTVAALGEQALEQRAVVARGLLVQQARVQRRGAQVGGGRDGVDVAREVQVEVLHGDHLRVAAARGAALDAKGGALRGLADAGEHVAAQHRAQRLAHANGGGGLALAQRRGVDTRDLRVGEKVEAGG